MIQQQTILKVIDNSGAKNVKCIKVLGGFKKKFACSGSVIIVSIQNLKKNFKMSSKIKKGDVIKALILKTKIKTKKKDGSFMFFKNNCVCLVNKQGNPIATRIIGLIPKNLKKNKFMKLTTLSAGFI